MPLNFAANLVTLQECAGNFENIVIEEKVINLQKTTILPSVGCRKHK